MDKEELIFNEYKLYTEQKDTFVNRNFVTNRFYMIAFLVVILAMIYTGNVVFMEKISAPFVFSIIGVAVCTLWWINVDTYNTLIKVKFSDVIEKLEESLPVKPFQNESEGIKAFRSKKIFMFSDIQKIIAILGALFFFAVFVSEFTPIIIACINRLSIMLGFTKVGI